MTGALVASAFLLLLAVPSTAVGTVELPPGSEDEAADAYYDLLLQQTRWLEGTYDSETRAYQPPGTTQPEQHAAALLGNAVLLRFGDYDADAAGIDRETLREHTLDSINYYIAQNRWIDPSGTWGGGRIFWDSTYQSYFTAAAKLLWDELDPETQDAVDQVTREQADYAAALEDQGDPLSSYDFEGLGGRFRSDSKIEEMGAMVIPLAAGLAYQPDAAKAEEWRKWMTTWVLNSGGLPPADQANYALIDGKPIREWNEAHNIWDTFVVENHGSFAPHYQTAISAQPGHSALHFLIAGKPVPQALRTVPNAEELWGSLMHLGTDAGIAKDLMVADRSHIYGIDALPLAYRAIVAGDRSAARAELMLLERLGPYADYPPEDRLTKFSAGLHYEAESRAEIASAYLLHYWRDQLHGDVEPISEAEYFANAARATDYGAEFGLIAQQSERSLAAAVTKAGFVKFAFLPQHDDWLFDVGGKAPSLIPSTSTQVLERNAHEYREERDGMEATATMLHTLDGYAGYTTLPNGHTVYATSGLAAGEGALRVYNLDMPGVPGLDGNRTFTAADGSVTLGDEGLGDGEIDEVRFDPVTARYVRFKAIEAGSIWGYSLWDFEVYSGDGPDLAVGQPTTASSVYQNDPQYAPEKATDGDPTTMWSSSIQERPCQDCTWLAVDLGSPREFDRVVLHFDPAYATKYSIQVSDDGETWEDVAVVANDATFESPWLNVDGRAGFVVRGSDNPIHVTRDRITLSDGPASGAAGMVVWARPGEDPQETADAAEAPQPSGGPPELRAALTDGYLSLFNLGSEPIADAQLTLPQPGDETLLYRGVQHTTGDETLYEVSLDGADARVEAPRFHLSAQGGGAAPAELQVRVRDSRTVEIDNLGDADAELVLRTPDGAAERELTVPSGGTETVVVDEVPLTPVADLARSRITYPTSPLPAGMTDPDLAVDGDPETAWRPGPSGRMVVDLGARRELTAVTVTWGPGNARPVTVQSSNGGLEFRTLARSDEREGRIQRIPVDGTGRFLAIRVAGWSPGDAEVVDLAVEGSEHPVDGVGDGGVDEVRFDPVTARYVRFKAIEAGSIWGYSLWDFEVYSGDGPDLAVGQPTTASSVYQNDPQYAPEKATDGDPTTMWSSSIQERPCQDCTWLAVDLGSPREFDRVVLHFDPAYATKYSIQVSDDGETWEDVAVVPDAPEAADTIPPTVTITAGPENGSKTADRRPVFEFTGSDDATLESGLRFECRIDSGEFDACESPVQLDELGDGPHEFAVRVIDEVGNTSEPETRAFRVITPTAQLRAAAKVRERVKPGKKFGVLVRVRNRGTAAAADIRVCPRLAPKSKRAFKLPGRTKGCVTVDRLDPGRAQLVRLTLTSKRKGLRPGRRYAIKVVVSARDASSGRPLPKRTATVKVRRAG